MTNSALLDKANNRILLLQKPRRNWWVAPGGKMEIGESVRESAIREYREETGLTLIQPHLRGIFTFLMMDGNDITSEWMMFTFQAERWEGDLLEQSPEGKLRWQPIPHVFDLDMAEGDRHIFHHVLHEEGLLYGTFRYTADFQLLSSSFEREND